MPFTAGIPYERARGHSSAVSSVLYSRGTDAYLETKTGAFIYNGDASSFYEWEFRTRLRTEVRKTISILTL